MKKQSAAYCRAEAIVAYLNRNVKVGHTTAVINGAKSTPDVLVVTANHEHSDQLRELLPHNCLIPLGSLQTQLEGRKQPLLLDNHALYLILSSLLNEINNYDQRIKETSATLSRIATDLNDTTNYRSY